jgi:hypothetical protein
MSGVLYKVLSKDSKPYHGGIGKWPLPKNGEPGEWLTVKGKLLPCMNGLHLCRESDLIYWLGPTIYEAEYNGHLVEHENKVVVRKARLVRQLDSWNERTARLFSCDCAEYVLHYFEKKYPDDSRVRTAIEVGRLYADGKATLEDLRAAWAAARAAAWAAARAAAGAAARAAAWDAARAAARAAAWDAAWDAARAAAWDAARAAAWDAARAAAWIAAGAEAGAVVRAWQIQRLMEYLRGEEI